MFNHYTVGVIKNYNVDANTDQDQVLSTARSSWNFVPASWAAFQKIGKGSAITMSSPFLAAEAVQQLRVTRGTLDRLTRAGQAPAFHAGGNSLVPADRLNERRQPVTPSRRPGAVARRRKSTTSNIIINSKFCKAQPFTFADRLKRRVNAGLSPMQPGFAAG